jgi:hypothetical protein
VKSEEQWCCTRCHATTIDVPLDLRTGGPSWPCRTCRRETQRERYGAMARREQPMCSHMRCKKTLKSKERFCEDHRPRFG